MNFGFVALFEAPEGRSEAEIVNDQIELMVEAESFGYHSVWPAEHHFSEYGYCATPAVTLAAVAARTERIRLGTGVVVLPLNHPVRVAEDYAFLDQLSGGRVDLGIGRGYQPGEFAGFDVDPGAARRMFRESIDVILKAWSGGRFTHDGEFYKAKDLVVRPRPLQSPHPPIWMAALSPESFSVCGQYGFNLLCAPVFGFNLEAGISQIRDYRACLDKHGHDPAKARVGALTITYVAETTQQARDELRDAVIWYYRTLARHISTPQGQDPARDFEFYGDARRFLETVDWETVLRNGAVVCGSPAEVADRIAELREACGITDILTWTRIGGLDKKLVKRSMELMSDKVIPLFS